MSWAEFAAAQGQPPAAAPETNAPAKPKPSDSTAPEQQAIGLDDCELAQVVDDFAAAHASMVEGNERIHHLTPRTSAAPTTISSR